MPCGTPLLLGRVLLMYWHKLTRLVRDMMYITAADIDAPLVIQNVGLTNEDLDSRKYIYLLIFTKPNLTFQI